PDRRDDPRSRGGARRPRRARRLPRPLGHPRFQGGRRGRPLRASLPPAGAKTRQRVGDPHAEEKELGMARFFIEKKNIRDGRAAISGAELDHMRKVLRLAPGDSVVLFDDGGFEHEGRIVAYTGGGAEIAIEKSHRPERESPLAITLAQALGKGDKFD